MAQKVAVGTRIVAEGLSKKEAQQAAHPVALGFADCYQVEYKLLGSSDGIPLRGIDIAIFGDR